MYRSRLFRSHYARKIQGAYRRYRRKTKYFISEEELDKIIEEKERQEVRDYDEYLLQQMMARWKNEEEEEEAWKLYTEEMNECMDLDELDWDPEEEVHPGYWK